MRSLSASVLFLSLVTLGASAVAACGGGQPEPTAPTTPSATPSAIPSAAPSSAPAASASAATPAASGSAAAPAASGSAAAVPTVWGPGMNKDQQVAFMKAHVVPRMKPVFQGGDAKKYAEFGCKTCHGPQYKEPKDFLPKLTMKDGKLTAFADKPQVAKFMSEKVVPEMATAMGMKPYDPATKQGFGCGGCHTIEQK